MPDRRPVAIGAAAGAPKSALLRGFRESPAAIAEVATPAAAAVPVIPRYDDRSAAALCIHER
jgi:hypothetical protein